MVTGPGSSNPIGGQMAAVKTYGSRVDEMVLAEPVAMKMALGENPKSTYHEKSRTPTTRMATAALIREQLFKASRYLEAQQAALEQGKEPPAFDMKCEALLPDVYKRQGVDGAAFHPAVRRPVHGAPGGLAAAAFYRIVAAALTAQSAGTAFHPSPLPSAAL